MESKINSYRWSVRLPPAHREQQAGDHESKGDGVVPRTEVGEERNRVGRELEHQQPDQADQHQTAEQNHEPHARRPGLDLDRCPAHRVDGEVVLLADFGLGHGYLRGQSGHTVRRCTYEPNVATLPAPNPERGADGPASSLPLAVALRRPAGVSI